MSFNPVMALLMQGVMPLVASQPRVLEFGNQTFSADDATLALVAERAARRGSDIDAIKDAVKVLTSLSADERAAATARFYQALGASSYTAIDVNDRYGSLVMDLNLDLAAAYGFQDTFDVVTNNGTGEHVFDQGALYRNAHRVTRVGGVMVHVMPFIEYINHGFYSFHPNFFYALAKANSYELMGMGVTTRQGYGAFATDRGKGSQLDQVLRDGLSVPLQVLLSEPKIPRRNFPRGWIEHLIGLLPNADEERQFGMLLHRLMLKRRKILGFAVLRKTRNDDFVVPIQMRYVDDVQAQELKATTDRMRA